MRTGFWYQTRTVNLKNLGVDVGGNWVPLTTAWRILKLWIEERPPICRVAANILNKHPRTVNKGLSSNFVVG